MNNNLQHMNPYMQAMMTGQYDPLQAMMARQPRGGAMVPPPMQPPQRQAAQGGQMDQFGMGGKGFAPGMEDLLKMLKGGPNLTQQWGGQGTPNAPQLMSGMEILKMMPGAALPF